MFTTFGPMISDNQLSLFYSFELSTRHVFGLTRVKIKAALNGSFVFKSSMVTPLKLEHCSRPVDRITTERDLVFGTV